MTLELNPNPKREIVRHYTHLHDRQYLKRCSPVLAADVIQDQVSDQRRKNEVPVHLIHGWVSRKHRVHLMESAIRGRDVLRLPVVNRQRRH